MKILVVESNPILLKIIAIKLQHQNYLVYSSIDGEHVRQLITQIKPDVIITKLRLKYISGFELIRFAKHELPNAYVIVITKINQETILQDLLKTGANVCIKRPFDIEQLINYISEFKFKKTAPITELQLSKTIPIYKQPIQLYKDATNKS
ncbi:response regulator [Hydrotalea sp.]|uniref:response regulator n=1 Tax=Hydrotalea sp. TaxID=2881279 RepID=UPI003D139FCB